MPDRAELELLDAVVEPDPLEPDPIEDEPDPIEDEPDPTEDEPDPTEDESLELVPAEPDESLPLEDPLSPLVEVDSLLAGPGWREPWPPAALLSL